VQEEVISNTFYLEFIYLFFEQIYTAILMSVPKSDSDPLRTLIQACQISQIIDWQIDHRTLEHKLLAICFSFFPQLKLKEDEKISAKEVYV
jgi:hypothetical protein